MDRIYVELPRVLIHKLSTHEISRKLSQKEVALMHIM